MKTWTIELRCDFDSDKKDECERILTEALKVAAKHVFTTALLISGKRKPQIKLEGGDFFSPTEEIMLADDIPQDVGEGA